MKIKNQKNSEKNKQKLNFQKIRILFKNQSNMRGFPRIYGKHKLFFDFLKVQVKSKNKTTGLLATGSGRGEQVES